MFSRVSLEGVQLALITESFVSCPLIFWLEGRTGMAYAILLHGRWLRVLEWQQRAVMYASVLRFADRVPPVLHSQHTCVHRVLA
jgi:hypothetical protein